LEVAINLGFVKDRILLETSWYQNRSDNQLVGLPVPPSVGFSSVQANLPAVLQNTGIEISLNTVNVKSGAFTWSSYFNISVPRNKLISYPGLKNSPYANTYTIGKPISNQKSFHFLGVDPKTGIYKFQDLDGSGTGTDYPGDLQASAKEIGQNYYGGLDNKLSFKGFQLDFLFQFVKQTGQDYVFNNAGSLPGTMYNQPVEVLNRWQKSGDKAPYQLFSTGGGNSGAFLAWIYASYFGDSRFTDASFIRLKNVSVSYQLSSKWVKSLKIDQASIFIQGQNLLTITSFIGPDPESQVIGVLPPLRTFVAGIRLTL